MKNLFKLNNKQMKRSGRGKWIYDDKWITNGHFMINRSLVVNHHAYCTPDHDYNENLERVIPCAVEIIYKKTNRLFEVGKELSREFESDCGQKAYFDNDYITHFEIDFVKGSDEYNAFIAHEGQIVLMPKRKPAEA